MTGIPDRQPQLQTCARLRLMVALADRQLQCRRWLATQITDEAADYRVQDALIRLRCDALADDMVALRHKYAQSPQALQGLDTASDIGI